MESKKLNYLAEYEKLLLEDFREGFDWNKIAFCDSVTPSEVIGLALNSGSRNICQTKHPYFAEDLNTSAIMLQDHQKFISFPLSSIMSPGEINIKTEQALTKFSNKFSRASQKSGMLSKINKILKDKNVSTSIQSDVMIIADELSTNAIFNAPFVDSNNESAGANRDDVNVKMPSGKSATVFMGIDHSRIVIGCKDPYGSLNMVRLFERIKKCYDTSIAENMNMTGRGGAGIGSYMVFNSAASYYAVVTEGNCTMILCALPLKMSSRTRLEMPKNLHFIITR